MNYQVKIDTNDRSLVNISDFNIEENKINFLFGESGIGKTLISKAIYGLLNSDDLKVKVNLINYDEYLKRKETSLIKENGFFLFQEPSSHLNPFMTIEEQLSEGDLSSRSDDKFLLTHFSGSDEKIEEFSRLLQLYPKTHRPSGGEKQRMLLIMAFKKLIKSLQSNKEESIFFFDEPTGSLDNRLRDKFLDLLILFFTKVKFTAVIITHDYSILSYLFGQYPSSQNAFSFSELFVSNTGQSQRRFNPNEYLSWISEARAATDESTDTTKTVLSIEPNYTVFGSKMQIYQGENNVVPLILKKGRLYYLKAESGVGKSTLISIIAGITKPEQIKMKIGTFSLDEKSDENIWRNKLWGKVITVVSQNPDEALNQNSKVNQILHGLPGVNSTVTDVKKLLHNYFDNVDSELLNKKIRYLSGGQKQRLNIMRGACLETDLLLMDEPLNGLDLESIKKVITIIQTQVVNGKTVLITSHNEDIFDALIHSENIYHIRKCN